MTMQQAVLSKILNCGYCDLELLEDIEYDLDDIIDDCIDNDDLTHPVKPYGRHTDFRCGACKRRIRSGNGSSSRIRDKFCQGCGRPIDWDVLKEDEQ